MKREQKTDRPDWEGNADRYVVQKERSRQTSNIERWALLVGWVIILGTLVAFIGATVP